MNCFFKDEERGSRNCSNPECESFPYCDFSTGFEDNCKLFHVALDIKLDLSLELFNQIPIYCKTHKLNPNEFVKQIIISTLNEEERMKKTLLSGA